MQHEYKLKSKTNLVAAIVVLNLFSLFDIFLSSQNHQFPDFQTTNPKPPRKHKLIFPASAASSPESPARTAAWP